MAIKVNIPALPNQAPAGDANSNEAALPQRVQGKDLFHAPQPPLTVADNSAISTGSGGSYVSSSAATTIANMRTRINQLETILIKLGLLRHP